MNTAKIFIELEIEIDRSNPRDHELALSEIADIACRGVVLGVKDSININSRKTKITDARYEFLINQNI